MRGPALTRATPIRLNSGIDGPFVRIRMLMGALIRRTSCSMIPRSVTPGTKARSLARRAHARNDLDRRLRRKEHPPAAITIALDRLTDQGLLDDEAYARGYVETRAARGRGPMRVRRDLMAMGVERSVVDLALGTSWPKEVEPEELARSLAAKRLRQLGTKLPRQALRRRLIQYLARRGFGGSSAGTVVGAVLGG